MSELRGFRARARAQAAELLQAIEQAEAIIVSTVERECEALRSGRDLAAKALHIRLCDAARLYLDATKAARASLWTIEQVLPGSGALLDEKRAAFADVLKVEAAILAAARAEAEEQARAKAGEPDGPTEDRRPGFPSARIISVGTAETRRLRPAPRTGAG